MISTSAAYKAAIDAPTRRVVPKAIIDLSDPDLAVTSVTGDFDATYSFTDQLTDKDLDYSGQVYATLEPGRWILDGTQAIFPDTPSTREGEQGIVGDTMSDENGDLNQSITIEFSGVDTLQMVTVASPNLDFDGHPTSLTLEIYSGTLLLYSSTEDVTGYYHVFRGFTVTQPNKIILTVNSWSLPGRYLRLTEILPGLLDAWGGDIIYKMHVIQQADFSNLTIPFASAALEIDNTNKRFDPADKDSIFLSVTARQPIPLFYGVDVGDSFEYVPVGIYYQKDEGWHIENDGMTICWDLVDLIGMMVERKYESPPEPDPEQYYDTSVYPPQWVTRIPPITKTLEQWISHLLNQLDPKFANSYTIDSTAASTSLTTDYDKIQDFTCGDMLRFFCQATNTFPITDPATGYLVINPLDNTPQRITTLRTQNTLPGSESNTDIAFLAFNIGGTLYNVPGTEEICDKTVNIANPFISTTMDAVKAAQVILTQYGGNVLNLECRGDPSRQVGDVETVEVYPNESVAARILEQTLSLENGVMVNQPLRMLQANGGKLYTDVIIITESGTYTMPAGITEITLVLIGGGQGGQGGQGGAEGYYTDRNGNGGAGGRGGKVYSSPLTINDGQEIVISIGAGGNGGKGGQATSTNYDIRRTGKNGDLGGDTTATLGTVFSSANGLFMSTGYVDLLTNAAYAVPGYEGTGARRRPQNGANGSFYGNGGNGGGGGPGSVWDPEPTWDANGVIVEHAGNGADGGRGANGVVLIFFNKE